MWGRALDDATEWKLNHALFHKIAEKFGKPDIYLFTTRINKQLDRYVFWHPETRGNGYQCHLSYLEQQWFLYVPPSSLVGWILVTIYRQDKCSDSCTRLVILVPAVSTDDEPGPVVFFAVTKKFDIATQNLQIPPAVKRKKL